MPSFAYFSSGNSYLAPYSSATDGGELVSEFNQRAALNVLGWKHVDLTAFNPEWVYDSWLSGTKTDEDLELSVTGSYLRVAPGEALVAGYYGDFMQELLIPTVEITTADAFPANSESDAVVTKFVKLSVMTTQSQNNRHDQRLIPPLGNQYLGVEISIDDILPTVNQLLLGTISRGVNGLFTVWNNPEKARTISIKHIHGAENYANLVEAPEDDGSIYGVKQGEDGNLICIDAWTWLAYQSPLGRYLRNMAKIPDDAGAPGVVGVSEMLHTIIGRADDSAVLRIIDTTNPKLEYRVLKNGNQSLDAYAVEQVPLPFANYQGHLFPDDVLTPTAGRAGIIEPKTLLQVDTLWADRDSMQAGRQFGPFETYEEAVGVGGRLAHIRSIMAAAIPGWDFQQNDYFWVLNDTLEQIAGDTNSILQTSFGYVSGTYDAVTTANITGPLTGSASVNDVGIRGTVSGSITGGSFEGTTSGSPPEQVTGTITTGSVDGTLQGTASTGTTVSVEGTGSAQARGTGTGRFTGNLDSFTQNVSTRYVYLPDTDNLNFDPEHPEDFLVWKRQAVLRGFSTPATPQTYGFVKPSSGAAIGDVIVDPTTNQLKLRPDDITMLQLAGWKLHAGGDIQINSDSIETIQGLEGTWFLNPVTIHLNGTGWDAETVPPLERFKGDVTVDISQAVVEEGTDVLPVINCSQINTLRLVVGVSNAKVNVEDCTVVPENFNSIYRWVSSRFTSGSNTAEFDNPWMTVNHAFSNTYDNSLQARFVSVTRGEYGIVGAEMDVWVKRAYFEKATSEDALLMRSMQSLNFPPFLIQLDPETGNIVGRQDIPTDVTLKISGAAGTHRTWDQTSSVYTISGNWLSTIDWKHGEPFVLNARMLNLAGTPHHGFFDVRFRASVQFTHVDDMMETSCNYDDVY